MHPGQEVLVQVFHGPNAPLQAEHWALPQIGPNELLVEISLATICGSDIHTITGHRKEACPAVLGHEGVGKIVKIGSQRRKDFIKGERVTWSIANSCGSCKACTDHNLPQKCQSLFKYGHAPNSDGTGLNGCYASHIVLRSGTHVVKVPDLLIDEVVAPANCALATVVNAVSKLPAHCESVLIQGAGLLGLYACALLHERGVKHVFCVDVQIQRLAQIERFGGIPIDGRTEYYPKARKIIVELAPDGVDAVLEMAGVASLVPEGIRLLRIGGYYGLVGMVHPNSQLTITGEQIIRKCLTIYGIHNYAPMHLDKAILFLQETVNKYPYESLVSPPFQLEKLNDAVHAAQTQQWCRVAVRPRV